MTMSEAAKSFTFISRSPPYGSNRPQLCLDAALATAVFEQEVNYLFLDDGVFQLMRNQQGDAIQAKTLGNAIETLDLYGIDNVLVDADSLRRRDLAAEDLLLEAKVVSEDEVRELLARSDFVVNL